MPTPASSRARQTEAILREVFHLLADHPAILRWQGSVAALEHQRQRVERALTALLKDHAVYEEEC